MFSVAFCVDYLHIELFGNSHNYPNSVGWSMKCFKMLVLGHGDPFY